MTDHTKPAQRPLKRLYAVSKREKGDESKADWFEIGAEWPTKTDGITRFSQNDGFEPLMASGKFDLVAKTLDD